MDRRIAALRLAGIGFFISISIILGVFAGRWLDSKFNSEPVFLITGLILGIVIAFYGVYRMVVPFIDKKQNKGGD